MFQLLQKAPRLAAWCRAVGGFVRRFWMLFCPAALVLLLIVPSRRDTTKIAQPLEQVANPVIGHQLEPSKEGPLIRTDLSPAQAREVERRTASGIVAGKLAAAKLAQRMFLEECQELRLGLDAWESELREWREVVLGLAGKDRGRALSHSPELVRGYRAVLAVQRPGFDRLREIRTRLEAQAKVVSRTHDDPNNAADVPDEQFDSVQKQATEVEAVREQYRLGRRHIDALFVRAGGEQGTKSLQEAVADQEKEEAAAEVAVIEASYRKAKEEAAKKIADARAKETLLGGETEAAAIVAAAEQKRDAARRAAEERKRKAEKDELRRLLKEPEVQTYLQPFVGQGFAQPRPGAIGGIGSNVRVGTAGPMSFSRLKAMGALEPTAHGLGNFLEAACVQNDRPNWGITSNVPNLSRENYAFLVRAQATLIKLAPVLVEDGRLAP